MITFITAILFRFISGIKNGSHYYIKGSGDLVASIMMSVLCLMKITDYPKYGWLMVIPAIVPILMYIFVLKPRKKNKIHEWETIVQSIYIITVALLGENLLLLFCSVYTGVWLFNWIIRYLQAKYTIVPRVKEWQAWGALWNTTAEEMEKRKKGNFLSWNTFSGKTKTLLGVVSLSTAILIWYFDLNLNINIFK